MTRARPFPFWLWALFPMLLAALFATLQLDDNAFNRDEPDSLYTAGIYGSGPGTLLQVWRFVEDVHPTQTQGWSKLLFIHGRIAGWSEPAIRSLSFLAGMLALAMIYRTGRDLFAPRAGHFALLLMSASVYFLAYMAVARAFALVVFFTTLIIHGYWRLALGRRPPGAVAALTLFAGCAGLLFSHYFASLLLPALGLFHLLFVTKDRRWRRSALVVVAAALPALLQLPGVIRGMGVAEADMVLQQNAMSAAEMPGQFLYVLSNYLAQMPAPAGGLFILLLFFTLARFSLRRLRAGRPVDLSWMLVFVAATCFLLMTAVNEIARIMKANRIRYMLPLLPPLALLSGSMLHRFADRYPRAVAAFLALWLFLGPALILSETDLFLFRYPSTFHHVQRVLQQRAAAGDLVVLERSLRDGEVLYLHPKYIPLSDQPWDTVFWTHTGPLDSAAPLNPVYMNIWLVYPSKWPERSFAPDTAPGRLLCERMEDIAGFTLERHARDAAGCERVDDRLEFERDIRLSILEISLEEGLLRAEAGLLSVDDYLLAHYSLALHVIDPRTGRRVAQGDVGVGPGRFVALRSDIDLSALPPGDYELHLALYDWQTGKRLSARDLQSGAVGDMHVMHRFRHG